MKKLKEFLSNPVMKIFLPLLMLVCFISLFTNAAQNHDVKQIAVLIIMIIDGVFLFIQNTDFKK